MSGRIQEKIFSQWRQTGIIRRLCLFALLAVCLAVFLHVRYERSESFELNTKSNRYVIAQTFFSFPDDDATQILRHQAVRDIGDIYRFDENQLDGVCQNIEHYLVEDEAWRHETPLATFEQMLKGLERLKIKIRRMRFTDERTLQKMKQLKMSVRNIEVGNSYGALVDLCATDSFWESVQDRIFTTELPKEAQDFLISQFQKEAWDFQQDISSQRILREKVQEVIPQKYTRVEPGSPILEPGQKITPRHLMMLTAMKDALAKEKQIWEPTSMIGSALLSLVFIVLSLGYLKVRAQDLFSSLSKMTLLVTILITTLVFAKAAEYFLFHKGQEILPYVHFPIFIPFASLLICMLIGTEIALFITAILSVVMALSLSSAFAFDRFLAINIVTGVTAILYSRRMRKRSQIFSVCARLFLISLPVILAFDLASKNFLAKTLFGDVATSFGSLFLTAVIVVGILPSLEAFFGLLTDITLMQLLDPNHPLLRRLCLEAPGTYQHCLVAGNLAESAAHAINANGLFCRVSTLYHDIGKLFNPHYFTENQFGGFNIHQLLTPRESAQVIMSHVTEGESLARKYRLPSSFIDIIREHHGTTLVYYFYCKQVEIAGQDVGLVDEKQFRYKGPKPRSRESAIIMIADSVEATTRSLDEISEEILSDVIDQIVKEKIDDGQFDECRLTFEELSSIKRTLIKTLLIAHHMRIKYPSCPTLEKAFSV
jgi:putative nucleotidyltransferase with HDIG domain